jgi:hypothetical protein
MSDAQLPVASIISNVARIVRQVEEETRQVNRFTAPDFSPFRFINQGEVITTRLLAYFLDASESHGQGRLFQDLFIDHLRALTKVSSNLPRLSWSVQVEKRIVNVGQIDLLLIAEDGFRICIENKPRDQTIDQYRQLTNYLKHIQEPRNDKYLLLYLSRLEREPHESSLSSKTRLELTDSGHYANITYQNFLLPLLDKWQQSARPKHLRRFLRQFRYYLEEWLNLPSTKPPTLMNETAIAAELLPSIESISAAFDIAASLPTLRQILLEKFIQQIIPPDSGLQGSAHWQWQGFTEGTQAVPFLIRRVTPGLTGLDAWPWKRYAIGLEFNRGRLFYGIRFDHSHWHPDDSSEAPIPVEAHIQLNQLVPTQNSQWGWWTWWMWAGPENDRQLCLALAHSDAAFLDAMREKIATLATALDSFCNSTSSLLPPLGKLSAG